MFFANARRVCDRIAAIVAAERPQPRVVLLDLSAVNDLEVTALERLADLADHLHALEMFRREAGLLGRTSLQADHSRLGVPIFNRPEDAVTAYEEQT